MNVENLQKLYRVGEKILRERLPLAFGDYGCGTFACLSGWYGREHGTHETYAHYNHDELFGTTQKQATQLFCAATYVHHPSGRNVGGYHPADEPGPEAYAELERRMEYLAGLIRKAGGIVPGSGLPDSVRQIFETEVANV